MRVSVHEADQKNEARFGDRAMGLFSRESHTNTGTGEGNIGV
jgi:hypothetical protein